MKFKSLQKEKKSRIYISRDGYSSHYTRDIIRNRIYEIWKSTRNIKKNVDYVAAANLATATSLYISEHPKEVEISDKDNEKL